MTTKNSTQPDAEATSHDGNHSLRASSCSDATINKIIEMNTEWQNTDFEGMEIEEILETAWTLSRNIAVITTEQPNSEIKNDER